MKNMAMERTACRVVRETGARRRPGLGLLCGILVPSAAQGLPRCVHSFLSIDSAAIGCLVLDVESVELPTQLFIFRRVFIELPALPHVKLTGGKHTHAVGGGSPWVLL